MKGQATLLQEQEATIFKGWMDGLEASGSRLLQALNEAERRRYSTRILGVLLKAVQGGEFKDIDGTAFEPVRDALEELSRDLAERGLTPSETATYVFSLKEPLFAFYKLNFQGEDLAEKTWAISLLVDKLGLFTFEAFARARETIIKSQAQAISELSTPVIQVWEGIIAVPLVGAVDSVRAKDIMEKLLEAVIAHEADVVIIDITGVPVVDTQVANRLMRTVEAVRLLGTKSIITGINPIVAQTLVQLGVELSQLTTKASLRAGLQQAYRELGIKVSEPAGKR